jgi:hypothetical protein
MRKYNKYGRKMTDRQCVLCQKVDSIFAFDLSEPAVCWDCIRKARKQALKPKYPLPVVMDLLK